MYLFKASSMKFSLSKFSQQTSISIKKYLLGLSAMLAMLSCVAANAGDFGVGVRGGTLGLGVELDYKLTDNFSLRAHAGEFSYDYEEEEDGIDYDGDVDLSTIGLSADWHPFGGAFRVSGGAYLNGNEINALASGDGEYDIGSATYVSDPSDPVQVNLDAELGSGTVPFVAVGWGNSPENESGLMFSFELGVLVTGTPSIDLTVSGSAQENGVGPVIDLGSDPTVQANVDEEIATLEDDISDFELWPVLMLGVGYRF